MLVISYADVFILDFLWPVHDPIFVVGEKRNASVAVSMRGDDDDDDEIAKAEVNVWNSLPTCMSTTKSVMGTKCSYLSLIATLSTTFILCSVPIRLSRPPFTNELVLARLSCQACQGTHQTPLDERRYIPLSSVQSLYVVELKLSLRTCLARHMHARCMPNP
jgi:hypothetical protein